MLKKYGDLFSGIFLFVFSIVLFIGSYSVKQLAISSIGSGFVPQVVAVLLLLVSLAIIRHGIIAVRATAPLAKAKKEQCAPETEEKANMTGVLCTIGLLAAYIATVTTVGFLISTALYLFFQMTVLATKQQRKFPLFIIISIVTSVTVYYTFVKVFHLMLPSGILG
jgi:putative tricarboxylic transport membrane protein